MSVLKRNIDKQYLVFALFLSIAIGFTIQFPQLMSSFYKGGHSGSACRHFGSDLLITVIVAFLMFVLNYYVLKPVEKHRKLKFWDIVWSILLTTFCVFILNYLIYSFKHRHFFSLIKKSIRWDEIFYENFFVSALVIGCILIIRLLINQQSIKLENETLKREALQSQFESLKNQLSPHFLFNSLTALKILISEAPDKAQNYVNNLSKALRYTLQSNEKRLVTLDEEMKFIDSYLYLIRIRFDKNLLVELDVDEELLKFKIPPLTIQTLIENAIKHNEVSKLNPLSINILTTENFSLIVSNIIQKKFNKEEGTGIGLANLLKQFEILLGPDKFTISKKDNKFIVEVPLIKP